MTASVRAGATVSLPPKTPDELVSMMTHTPVRALSGTVQQTAGLGLPAVPTLGPGTVPGAAPALEFLTGTHTARVYVDGPAKARIQIMDALAERDLVVNQHQVWFYNSADNSATHVSGGTEPATPQEATPAPVPVPTPGTMANHFLTAIKADTRMTVGPSSTIAGRTAYRLDLAPGSADTLVDSVGIDVDSETGLPLAVEVKAKGQTDPAYTLAYTDLSLSSPDAGLFDFTPPQGASVTEKALPAKPTPASSAVPPSPTGKLSHPNLTVTGQGWSAIVALPAGSVPSGITTNPTYAQVMQPVPGGHALTTSLVNVLVLDDGRVFAGMVPLDRLQSAAAAQ
ncbi:DUF2092 domain-containing protein [Arthrobacter sp. SIMBA_036]|uniref:LolA family protein n=1 Tax=Arthrobacter sp. SIMBA_036 TaxID=3085778 RepID=UPI00397BE95A